MNMNDDTEKASATTTHTTDAAPTNNISDTDDQKSQNTLANDSNGRDHSSASTTASHSPNSESNDTQ